MTQPMPGAERIRAIQDQDGMYQAFDSYPWTKDKTFMSGLYAILGDPNSPNPRGDPSELALHARIFYYTQRVGVTIDFANYKDWLARHPDHTPPDVIPESYGSIRSTAAAAAASAPISAGESTESTDDVPAWQASAPKAELYVEKQNPPTHPGADGDKPAYPMGFAEMLQRLQRGETIPGIREIPDTVIRDPTVKPVGTRAAPKKPWEKAIPAVAESPISALDSSFPSLEDEKTTATGG
ncbi:hypothetical protein SODALDRAFT_327729 [Sodiomyces alkalinus F11]|uniref:Uncharacterized protein n=1 Tax=Sodiomyces alkalinus (strain CBS 110278 / VKM F-3762 / F11) TaxID=1314773 RepID=A0A3N2Q9S7_SODAK|nr:hypothetical protein SODALDRAFT_327729 [Sodiomyces alkalinus F11]ROT43524.1 hypothetical protein SODALDRAFT_327729 [Sodiomyces alkalinus F11]